MSLQQQPNEPVRIAFTSVDIIQEPLGNGSYGYVCKAQCDDLLCAAKILHDVLFDPAASIERHREHRQPYRRFLQEIEFLSTIKHPNIVQFLGTHHDPITHLPVLLMELMDESLTHYLESSEQPLSYHIQVDLSHDIAKAISFLHSNHIAHRDLSGNNVLLIGRGTRSRAKVADFGMARLYDASRELRSELNSLTGVPGANVYMPPEALDEPPVYSNKIDCFSFGVLIIQILTRKYPQPGTRFVMRDSNRMCVPEIERRHEHINEVNPNHLLLPVALECLRDQEVERPTAHDICLVVAELKLSEQYRRAAEQIRLVEEQHEQEIAQLQSEHDEQIGNLQRENDERIEGLHREYYERIQNLHSVHDEQIENVHRQIRGFQEEIQQCRSSIQERDESLAASEQENHQLNEELDRMSQKLSEKEQTISEKESTIVELQQQLQSEQQQHVMSVRDVQELHGQQILDIQQFLKEGASVRQEENQQIVEEVLQLQQQLDESRGEVRAKNIRIADMERELQNKSEQLENSEHIIVEFQKRISELEKQLRSGPKNKRVTNLKWMGVKSSPMKMWRHSDAVVHGTTVYFRPAETQLVYSYESTNDTWSIFPNCPYADCSLAIVNGQLTTIGGSMGQQGDVTNLLCSLSLEGGRKRWVVLLPSMPTRRKSTVVVFKGEVLVVAGGIGTSRTVLRDVEVFNMNTREWNIASMLPQPLSKASATICDDYLYIIGGYSTLHVTTKEVFTCSLATLLQSCQQKALLSSLSRQFSSKEKNSAVWSKLPNVPTTLSTCATLNGQLLVVGGVAADDKVYSGILAYQSHTKHWDIVSRMPLPSLACFTAVLPGDRLMVIGGLSIRRTTGQYYLSDDADKAMVADISE